eukprot:COSAG01_NODE_33515_length_563_cov_0.528017_1_plen_20_part_10
MCVCLSVCLDDANDGDVEGR